MKNTKWKQQQDEYLQKLLGHLAVPGYYSQPTAVEQASTLVSRATVVIPNSSRKASLGER